MTAPVREGEILAGKYRVDRVLGAGGMGVVVAAHHIDLDEKVAIKFLLPETLGNAEAVARFAREARAAVKIKSEHVARVSDVGKLENGAPYMVMEYLEGGDLSSWLVQRGALPIEQAVEFILQACEAIAEAHALGIVHRDLKPANLFVIRRADGRLSVKVLDFGISKMTSLTGSGGDASMTKTSSMMGSPLYMSPEQMQSSKNVDARGDIWALGVILYECVTGSTPFTGDSMPELILQTMQAQPPPMRNKRPDAPPGLEAVILRCLNKDRGKRYETVGELAVALLPFAPKRSKASVERISGVMKAAGFSASALAVPPSSDEQKEAQPAPAGTAASWGRTTTGKPSGRWLVFGGIGALFAVIAGIVMTRKPASTEDAASASAAASLGPIPVPPAAPSAQPEQAAIAPPEPVPSAAAPVVSVSSTAVDHPKEAPPASVSGPRKKSLPSKSGGASKVSASPPTPPTPPPVAPPPAPATKAPPAVAPAPPKKATMFDDRK